MWRFSFTVGAQQLIKAKPTLYQTKLQRPHVTHAVWAPWWLTDFLIESNAELRVKRTDVTVQIKQNS